MSTRPSPILVINNGSSSLKFSVIDPKSERVLSSGLGERIGTAQGLLKLVDMEEVKHEEYLALADHLPLWTNWVASQSCMQVLSPWALP
jgi:acetate kinase